MVQKISVRGLLLIIIVLSQYIDPQTIEAQNKIKPQDRTNLDYLLKAEVLFYFGVDFSHLRITDGPKISRSYEYSKVYPSSWIACLEKELITNGYLKKALKKDVVHFNQDDIYDRSLKVLPDFIIGETYSFPFDTIESAVKNYKLNQKSGIGLVLIPENFSKPQELARTWIVFFDIDNRDILYAKKVLGTCTHMGYTHHWCSGVIDGFESFIRNQYR